MRNGFILRFDDLCPTVNWDIWNSIEDLLVDFELKPIISVIPDNRDKALVHGRPGENFWDRVQSWQRRGWTIGLHGYQHCYLTKNPGMFGRTGRSEFAGLPSEVQEIKLRNAVRIFHQRGVKPEVWVAPAHSFDASTLEILLKLGVNIVNDGYALFPYEDHQGLVWIPQQVGRLRKLPIGVWTVCFHFNDWNDEDLKRFREDLQRFRQTMISVDDVLQHLGKRRRNWMQASAARLLDVSLRLGRPLRQGLRQGQWHSWSKSFRRPHENNGNIG
jgi:predicted deacetylase